MISRELSRQRQGKRTARGADGHLGVEDVFTVKRGTLAECLSGRLRKSQVSDREIMTETEGLTT